MALFLYRGGTLHSSQDFKSAALQVCLRAGVGQPLHGPPVRGVLHLVHLLLLLVFLHLHLHHLDPAPPLLKQVHVQVPEVAGVLLALHPLDELWVEAQVVSDAVLPTVVRRREEREVCAEEKLFEHY